MITASTPPQQGGPVSDRPETSVAPPEISGDDRAAGLEEILQGALTEARAEVARREEAERKLDRVRIEAANLAIELNQAERELERARESLDPSAAERIEKLEEDLSRARSELVGERERREQLERDYDAAAHQSETQLAQMREETAVARDELATARADQDRQVARLRDGHAQKLTQLRDGHEQQVTQLRDEQEQRLAELQREHERKLASIVEEHEQQLEGERATAQPEPPSEQPAPPPEPLISPPIAVEPPPAAQPHAEELPEAPTGRLRRRKRLFETRGRTCAVCRRTEAASPGALQDEGWALGAEIDICPDCGAQGWQLPKGGNLPFRRSSSRQEPG
jgi:hypothetical protein